MTCTHDSPVQGVRERYSITQLHSISASMELFEERVVRCNAWALQLCYLMIKLTMLF